MKAPALLLLVWLAPFAAGCGGGAGEAGELAVDSAEVERLRALGYVNVAPALPSGAQVGVLTHDERKAASGLTLFTNAKFCSAQLIGMDGRVHHGWRQEPCFRWGNVTLTPTGDLLAVWRLPHEENPQAAIGSRYLARLDWDGALVWNKQLAVHHDVEMTPDGRILTLTYEFRRIPEADPDVPLRDNSIVMLDGGGEVTDRLSLWDLFHSNGDSFSLQEGKIREFEGGRELDLFHTNSVEWIRHPELVGTHDVYRPSSVLICVRNQDTLAILDWDSRELLWTWGQGETSGPHDATLLPGGNVLAFDNGLGRDWSRVIEVDPRTSEVVWEYRAEDPRAFHSKIRGASQRLGNGNTLITDSQGGRLFEVTPDGDTVWEFLNPNMTEKREPSVIVRARRFEGLDYAELERRIRTDAGVGLTVD